MSQWDYWDATSDYHSNSHHPYCSCCKKYLVIPTIDKFTAQTCEHYDAWISGKSENADFSGYGLVRGVDIGGRVG